MFSYVSAEQRVPAGHPLRAIRALVDDVLRDMSREFDRLYARVGRPSIPPERLLRAQLLQVFYTIRSERLLMEQLDYNLLFRWFVGMDMDEPIGPDRLQQEPRSVAESGGRAQFLPPRGRSGAGADVGRALHGRRHADRSRASQKSFQRKDGGADGDGRNFRGDERKNDTHASTTDPDARLYRKSNGAEARLAYLGHLLIENRHGLIADAMATIADGYAEIDAATQLVAAQWERAPQRHRTVGADKAYDVGDFVGFMRDLDMTPHVTQNVKRSGGARSMRARRDMTVTPRVSMRARASNRHSGG